MVRNLVDPTGLAIDVRQNRIFWTDRKAGKVQCAQLDGSRVCDVAMGLQSPMGLALGPTHLFWTDRARGAIQSCCLKTGIVRDVIDGLQAPEGIAVLNGRRPMPTAAPASFSRVPLGLEPAVATRQQRPRPRRAAAPGSRRKPQLAVRVSAPLQSGAPSDRAWNSPAGTRNLAEHTLSTQEIMRRTGNTLSRMLDGECLDVLP